MYPSTTFQCLNGEFGPCLEIFSAVRSSENGSWEKDMEFASIFVSNVEYIDASEKRYCVLGGAVVGSLGGIGRG